MWRLLRRGVRKTPATTSSWKSYIGGQGSLLFVFLPLGVVFGLDQRIYRAASRQCRTRKAGRVPRGPKQGCSDRGAGRSELSSDHGPHANGGAPRRLGHHHHLRRISQGGQTRNRAHGHCCRRVVAMGSAELERPFEVDYCKWSRRTAGFTGRCPSLSLIGISRSWASAADDRVMSSASLSKAADHERRWSAPPKLTFPLFQAFPASPASPASPVPRSRSRPCAPSRCPAR